MKTLVGLLKTALSPAYIYDYTCRHFSSILSTTATITPINTVFYVYDTSYAISEHTEPATGTHTAEPLDFQEETEPLRPCYNRVSPEQYTYATAHITITTNPNVLYYGYRFYSPGLGRWINRDPIGERGGLNVSAFALNAPTIIIDINGEYPIGPILAAGRLLFFILNKLGLDPGADSPPDWSPDYEFGPSSCERGLKLCVIKERRVLVYWDIDVWFWLPTPIGPLDTKAWVSRGRSKLRKCCCKCGRRKKTLDDTTVLDTKRETKVPLYSWIATQYRRKLEYTRSCK